MAIVQPENDAADQNKTEITLRVTEAASAWLSNLGAKCVETEVPVDKGWVADLAAFWSPTMTEASRAKLIRPSSHWPYGGTIAEQEEHRDHENKRLAEYRQLPSRITIVLEVKTSLRDFYREETRSKKFQRGSVAHMQVLSYTTGSIPAPRNWPPGWWCLEHSPKTGTLLKAHQRPAVLRMIDTDQQLNVIANIAERRHNRTARQYFSALQKRQRVEDGGRRADERLSSCMRAVLAIARGEETVEEALKGRLRGGKVPDYLLKELRGIHGTVGGTKP